MEAPAHDTKPHHLRVAMLFTIALVAYVLSVGPVLVSAERFGVSRTRFAQPLRAFYYPVLATARSGDVGTRLYESYVGMWYRVIMGRAYPDEAIYK
jgi:hypothetical protein